MSKNAVTRATVSAVACLAVVLATGSQAAALPRPEKEILNVRDFGATGDGVTNDTPAVNAAIVSANGLGGRVVRFPAGTYLAGGSIHMMSNVTILLDAGATLLG